MTGLSEAIATLMLIVPGFIAAGAMTFSMGLRQRDLGSSLVWSLFFSIAIYGFLFVLIPVLTSHLPFFKPFADSLTVVGNLNTESTIRLLDAIRTSSLAVIVAIPIGLILGWLQKNKWVQKRVVKVTGHTYHTDIWGDFIEQVEPPSYLEVFMKDGDAFLGTLSSASDTYVGADKGLILKNVKLINNAIKNGYERKNPKTLNLPGPVIVYFEQIAFVAVVEDKWLKKSSTHKVADELIAGDETTDSTKHGPIVRFALWLERVLGGRYYLPPLKK